MKKEADEKLTPSGAGEISEQQSVQDPEPVFEPKILEKMPVEVRQLIVSFLANFSGSAHPPFLKKINEEHISKILDLSENESKRVFEDTQSTKKYNLAYVLIFCALFVFSIVYLGDKNPDLLKEILKYLAVFAGGGGFGYALRAYRNKETDD